MKKKIKAPIKLSDEFSDQQKEMILEQLCQVREVVGKLRAEITMQRWYPEYAKHGKYPTVYWGLPINDGPNSGVPYSYVIRVRILDCNNQAPASVGSFRIEYLRHPGNFPKILFAVSRKILTTWPDPERNWIS